MVEGEPPYKKISPYQITDLTAVNETPAVANPENLTVVFKNYLDLTLSADVEKRPTASELLQVTIASPPCYSKVFTRNALQHAFFTGAEPLGTLAPMIKMARHLSKN